MIESAILLQREEKEKLSKKVKNRVQNLITMLNLFVIVGLVKVGVINLLTNI